MVISGDGFKSFNVRIKPNFKPVTKLAVKWEQLANGSYIAVGRNRYNDIYESELAIYGKEDEIDHFIDVINVNRFSGSQDANQIRLSEFNESEKIFGAEILYGHGSDTFSINATVIKIKEKEQKSWLGYGLKMTLRALEQLEQIPYDQDAPEFPELKHLNIGYTGDSELTLTTIDSYSGKPFFIDSASDTGSFEGTFTLKTIDMAILRSFLVSNRGAVINPASDAGKIINGIPGIRSLFGRRRYEGPFTVRITEWNDMGMNDLQSWKIKLKIVEDHD